MKIYLCGQGAFALQVAEALTESSYPVIGVSSPRVRKGHVDDNTLGWDRLRSWSYPRRIPWTDAEELRARHVTEDTDVIIAAHSHSFIGRDTRRRARITTIGYHPSLLPLHRGRDAIRWTVRDGDKVTGGTVYHLSDRTDAGPIAAQEHVIVPRGSTVESLWREHLAPLGVRLLLRVIADLSEGRSSAVQQDESLATWEPAMDAAPLHKPELLELPGSTRVQAGGWAAPKVTSHMR